MSYSKICRRSVGFVMSLALFTSPCLATQLQVIPAGQRVLTARKTQTPHVFSSSPQGAALIYRDSTNLSPFSSCNANQAWPWTAVYSPDGGHLYIPLFGGFTGQGGCTVLKLDAVTLQHLGTIQVQESPEEVVFTTDTSGFMARGFATNSAASTVTVFDGADQVLANVSIPVRPGNTWGSAFPFGMAVSPDQNTIWVGTSEGNIFALDVASLTLDLSRTIDLGPETGFTRITSMGNNLVIPATMYHPNYQGSTAKLIVMDPDQPMGAQELILATSPTTAAFPSPQDVAVQNGRIYVAGFDMGPQVFVVDAGPLTLAATWPTGTGHPQGKFQALTLSPAGLLLVADYTTSEIARIDSNTGFLLGVLQGQTYGFGPQELTLSPDGQTLLVPTAADNLVRFDVH